MKIIPSFVHGILDYVVGLALLLAPNLFGFAAVGGPAVWVPRAIAIVVLLQTLMTDYELGAVKVLSLRMHLMADYVLSIFLAASPWIFGFKDQPQNVWMPHLVVGIAVFLVTLMTQPAARGTAQR